MRHTIATRLDSARPSRRMPDWRSMLRRLASILCVLGALVWAGCGSGDPPAQLPYTSITRSDADAVARDLTIRAGDLPEFKATAHAATSRESPEVDREPSCPDSAVRRRPVAPQSIASRNPSGGPVRDAAYSRPRPSRAWAIARSERLSAGNGYHALGAYSSVSIMPTATAARRTISELREIEPDCLARAFRRGFSKSRLGIRGVVVEPLARNLSEVDASVAYQVVVGWRFAPLVLYTDLTFFAYGQDVVTLATFHLSKPVPPAMDSRLLSLLVARARAHSR